MNHLTTTRRTGSKLLGARRRVASRLGPMRSRAVSVSCPLTPANSELGTQNSKLGTRVPRPALSLVELLVVIVILTILVAAVLPSLAPSSEDRRLREATRGVTAAFTKARSRALASGRPAGVELARMANEPGASMVLYQVEVPPPFAGYSEDSVVRINPSTMRFFFFNSSGPESIPESLVHIGDTIQFNYQGPIFKIIGLNQSGNLVSAIEVQATTAAAIPWANGQEVPYQITRQPVRTSAAPHQLPEGMVIDLFASGIGDDFFHRPFTTTNYTTANNNTDPILIMYSPSGRLHSVWHNETATSGAISSEPALSQVYLLVGKREKIPEASLPQPYDVAHNTLPNEQLVEKFNWKDLDSRWVVVSPRTGQVSAGENGFIQDDLATLFSTVTDQDDRALLGILASRRLARDMRSLGGN